MEINLGSLYKNNGKDKSDKNFYGITEKKEHNSYRGKLSDENRINLKNINFNSTAPIDFSNSKLKDVIEETDKLMEEVKELSNRKVNDSSVKTPNRKDSENVKNKTSSSQLPQCNQRNTTPKKVNEFSTDLLSSKIGKVLLYKIQIQRKTKSLQI